MDEYVVPLPADLVTGAAAPINAVESHTHCLTSEGIFSKIYSRQHQLEISKLSPVSKSEQWIAT